MGMRSPTHPWGALLEPSAPVSWERRRFPGIFGVFLGLEFEPDAPGGFCTLFQIQSQLPLGWGTGGVGMVLVWGCFLPDWGGWNFGQELWEGRVMVAPNSLEGAGVEPGPSLLSHPSC